MDKEQLWKAILGDLQITASEIDTKTFFPQIKAEKFENGVLEISCFSPIVKKRVEERYYNSIKNISEKILKERVELLITIRTAINSKNEYSLGPLFADSKIQTKLDNRAEAGLLDKYSFETFVVGSSNRLAHTVALTVADRPGKAYNPYFIYSGVGLGKTHLMQAIGNRILDKSPNTRIVYCTGESFTNELLESLRRIKTRGGTLTQFKDKFRKADVLLIDDIQFIAGKETTQEEFFHAFNTLFMAGKQIVLTSDRPPSEIDRLEKRLSSRFVSGMIADIQNPDTDVRSAILRNKRDTLGLNIPNEIVDLIAENVQTNIRELEGVFIQIATQISASDKPLNEETVKQMLGLKVQKTAQLNSADIIKAVATYYSVKLKDIKGTSRLKEIVLPRQIAMYILRTETTHSLLDIGSIFGGKDHSTVIHAVDKIKGSEEKDSKIKQDIVNIKATLKP